MTDGKTSIKLLEGTRDKLRSEKTGGETYDDVICRLLDRPPASRAVADGGQ